MARVPGRGRDSNLWRKHRRGERQQPIAGVPGRRRGSGLWRECRAGGEAATYGGSNRAGERDLIAPSCDPAPAMVILSKDGSIIWHLR